MQDLIDPTMFLPMHRQSCTSIHFCVEIGWGKPGDPTTSNKLRLSLNIVDHFFIDLVDSSPVFCYSLPFHPWPFSAGGCVCRNVILLEVFSLPDTAMTRHARGLLWAMISTKLMGPASAKQPMPQRGKEPAIQCRLA